MPKARRRKLIIVSGGEQTGKTYYTEWLAEQYIKSGGIAFAYNAKYKNFKDYHLIEILSIKEHIKLITDKEARKEYKEFKEIIYFRYNGGVYHFKDFLAFCLKRGIRHIKARRLDPTSEKLFFNTIYKYMVNTFIMFDDTRQVFRHGLSNEMIELFNSKNHAGEYINTSIKGVDIALIYHNIDKVNSEIWDYTDRVILLKSVQRPNCKKIDNPETKTVIQKGWEMLNSLPQYSRLEIPLKGSLANQIKIGDKICLAV